MTSVSNSITFYVIVNLDIGQDIPLQRQQTPSADAVGHCPLCSMPEFLSLLVIDNNCRWQGLGEVGVGPWALGKALPMQASLHGLQQNCKHHCKAARVLTLAELHVRVLTSFIKLTKL